MNSLPQNERAAEPSLDEPAGVVVELNPSLTPSDAECCWKANELRPVPRRPGAIMSAGALAAHARFLQRYFKRKVKAARAVAKRLEAAYVSPWCHGGLRAIGPVRVDVAMPRCQGRSFMHATDADFAEQKALAEKVMDWYRPYVDLSLIHI